MAMLIPAMIHQLVVTSEPLAALVIAADFRAVMFGCIGEMRLFVAYEVSPSFEATAAAFKLAHVLVTA